MSKIFGNGKFGRFDVVLKLNFEAKCIIGRRIPNRCPPTWGALMGAISCLVVFQNYFKWKNLSLNLLKFYFNSGRTPP